MLTVADTKMFIDGIDSVDRRRGAGDAAVSIELALSLFVSFIRIKPKGFEFLGCAKSNLAYYLFLSTLVTEPMIYSSSGRCLL